MRDSNPVRASISFSSSTAMPPRRTWPNESVVWCSVIRPPSERVAPSATTTIENVGPDA